MLSLIEHHLGLLGSSHHTSLEGHEAYLHFVLILDNWGNLTFAQVPGSNHRKNLRSDC